MRWILRYIKGNVDVRLVFEKDVEGMQECTGYMDFYYAWDLDKCRSNYRVCLYLVVGTGELALYLQSIVALSRIEAEYMALTEAVNEAIWLFRA